MLRWTLGCTTFHHFKPPANPRSPSLFPAELDSCFTETLKQVEENVARFLTSTVYLLYLHLHSCLCLPTACLPWVMLYRKRTKSYPLSHHSRSWLQQVFSSSLPSFPCLLDANMLLFLQKKKKKKKQQPLVDLISTINHFPNFCSLLQETALKNSRSSSESKFTIFNSSSYILNTGFCQHSPTLCC